MQAKIILTLLGVFAVQNTSAETDQSETNDADNQPIALADARERQRDTPEVVLQLKYNDGELNKIYLTQFRKETKGWNPSVFARSSLCADLCHSGLGGAACGGTCPGMMPIGLKTALNNGNETEAQFGQPRVDVCPTLCEYELGQPLCNCAYEDYDMKPVDWAAVCAAFCATDRYVLNGCPVCEENSNLQPQQLSARALTTVEGWRSWCNIQCMQGQGGAACNCDRAPFQ